MPQDEPGTERKIELLQEAIGKLAIVQFFYRDEFRVVEPHALGVSRSGEYLLAAWQIFGTRPGSHCYHVAGIYGLN